MVTPKMLHPTRALGSACGVLTPVKVIHEVGTSEPRLLQSCGWDTQFIGSLLLIYAVPSGKQT